MLRNSYLYYKDYLKNRDIEHKLILISKTNNSYLIGPLIDAEFRETSFYLRIKSNSIFSSKIYKKMSKKRCLFLINKYINTINSNEVLEVFKDENSIIHKIIKVPGDNFEKK